MNVIHSVNEDFNLYKSNQDITSYYQFYDHFVRQFSKNNDIYIRQITELEDLKQLSEARKRMYSKYDDYLSKLYQGQYFIDELDLNSYLFACFHKGEIVGIQRASLHPYEVSNYISDKRLTEYFGPDYKSRYVEFSRLLVDKHARIRGVSSLLGFVAGSLVSLSKGYENYFTYSKPRLRRKNIDFDENVLTFKIPERNNSDYQIFKGSLSHDIKRIFSVGGDSYNEVISNFKNKVLNETKYHQERMNAS